MARWTDLAPRQEHTTNQGGGMSEHRGVVLHIAEGSYEGTISWQKNPTSDVSSHFIVDTDGDVCQMVDTDTTAWTQKAGNGHWLSIENAGHTPNPLTAAQVEAAAQLLARAHRDYGVPLQVTSDPDGRGLGHHSMGAHPGYPDDWGHSACPGKAIIDQKPAIVARAKQIIEGDDMPLSKDDANLVVDTLLARVVASPALAQSKKVQEWWKDGEQAEREAKAAKEAVAALEVKVDAVAAELAEIKAALAALGGGPLLLKFEGTAQSTTSVTPPQG